MAAVLAAISAALVVILTVLAATAALLSVIKEYNGTPFISVNNSERSPPSLDKAAL